MKPISKEYLLLFNAISDAEKALNQLRETRIAAQQHLRPQKLFAHRILPPPSKRRGNAPPSV